MSKFGTCVSPAAIRAGLLIMPLFLGGIGASVFAQERPPITEEERQARDALNKGVNDFKNGQYDEAIADFQHAKHLDPNLINARLYLATAYASLYIPGAPSEENRSKGEAAVREFKEVLAMQPENVSAIDGVGSILFQMAGQPYDVEKFKESKSYHQKHIEVRPDDPEPYYWIGVIDWTLSFRANAEMRAAYNRENEAHQIRDTSPLPTSLRGQYRREYDPTIDEGIDSLKHAIALRPDYDDAMAYLNLMYRRKADTVNYQNERDTYLKMADELVDKVLKIKQKRAEPPTQP